MTPPQLSLLAGIFASIGIATVTGTGSSWTSSGDLTVGLNGNGWLQVENGGSVNNANGSIGSGGGTFGSATVTGAGSMWSNNGGLTVGNSGTGTLAIESGGGVTSAGSNIGFFPSSSGTVTVTGTGSTFTDASVLQVGLAGSGTLNISTNGLVQVTGQTVIKDRGTVTLNGGTLETDTLLFQDFDDAALRAAGLWSDEAEKSVADEQRQAYRDGLQFVAATAYRDGAGHFLLARFDHPKFPSDGARWDAWLACLDADHERLG